VPALCAVGDDVDGGLALRLARGVGRADGDGVVTGRGVPLEHPLHPRVVGDRGREGRVEPVAVRATDAAGKTQSETPVDVVSSQSPSSIRTWTRLIPVCCAQATPAIATFPAATRPPLRGTSMRDSVLMGPRSDQPRSVQYARASA
jgi:hypothetical protein